MMKQFLRKMTCGFVFIALLSATAAVGFAASVPFKGGGNGEIIGVVAGQTGVSITAVGEGTATLLGKFTREEHLLLNPETGAFTGDVVFTAADGSQLTATLDGQFTSATSALGSYTLTGGTGRFANTSGSAVFSANMSDPVHFTFEFSGNFD
jgi:hypothetical protein